MRGKYKQKEKHPELREGASKAQRSMPPSRPKYVQKLTIKIPGQSQ